MFRYLIGNRLAIVSSKFKSGSMMVSNRDFAALVVAVNDPAVCIFF